MNRRVHNSIAVFLIALGLTFCAAPRVSLAGDAAVKHESAIPAADVPAYITAAINSPDRPAANCRCASASSPDRTGSIERKSLTTICRL